MDDMVEGYIEAALWAGNDWSAIGGKDNPDPLDENYGVEDVEADTVAEIREDCQDFADANAADLETYCETYDMSHAGHDFYLTRNGHGAGFWDRGIEAGDRLSDAAKAYGPDDLDSTPQGTVARM